MVPYGANGAVSIGYDNIASDAYAASIGGLYNSVSSTAGAILGGSGNTVRRRLGF